MARNSMRRQIRIPLPHPSSPPRRQDQTDTNVDANAGSKASRNSPTSRVTSQYILCDSKLSSYYILWLAPLANGYEFHLYYDI